MTLPTARVLVYLQVLITIAEAGMFTVYTMGINLGPEEQ